MKAEQYLDRIENKGVSSPTYSRQEVIKFAELYAKYLKLNNASQCNCSAEETTGNTSVLCCNICGKSQEKFWNN